jgi:hypothetical protein
MVLKPGIKPAVRALIQFNVVHSAAQRSELRKLAETVKALENGFDDDAYVR